MKYADAQFRPTITESQLPDYDELVERLARHWAALDLKPEWFWEGERLPEPMSYVFIDFRHVVGDVLIDTGCPQKTDTILRAVLAQAVALGKTSFWAEREMHVEGLIEHQRFYRPAFIRADLAKAATVDTSADLFDVALDAFNERMTRFTTPTP